MAEQQLWFHVYGALLCFLVQVLLSWSQDLWIQGLKLWSREHEFPKGITGRDGGQGHYFQLLYPGPCIPPDGYHATTVVVDSRYIHTISWRWCPLCA